MTINVQGVPDGVAKFIRDFYAISDDKAALDLYADQLVYGADTVFQIGPMKQVKTRDEVLAWRGKAWDVVAKRKHSIGGVYAKAGASSIDEQSPECMLFGRVDYTKHDGTQSGADWGGHMLFEKGTLKDGAEPRLQQYRVWITPDA